MAAKVYGGSFHKASSSADEIAIEREWDVKGSVIKLKVYEK